MTLDFTALDFETANSYRGSPCSVGLAKVRGGQIVDEAYTLIHPPARYDHFDGFNTWVHGITADKVADAPPWRSAMDWILDYCAGDPLVCHNAGFDIGVIRYACVADEMHWPTLDFLCTLVLARRAYRLPSYRLPFVAAECAIDGGRHHLASDDARCAALIAVTMAGQQVVDSLDSLAEAFGVRVGHMESGYYKPSAWLRPHHGLIQPDANPNADPEHPLYGRTIVFTGALFCMTRQIAWEQVSQMGGIPEPTVTKRTNILVIGDINPAVLAPGTEMTGKMAHAFALQAKGQEIEVMTEDDYLRSL